MGAWPWREEATGKGVRPREQAGHQEWRVLRGGGRAQGPAGAGWGGGPQGGACYVFKSCLSAGCSCLASLRDSGDSLPLDTMTIDGPVALFKSSTNCSRAPFSAPGPYCWSGPLKARPGPEPPEAPAWVQPCASPARRLPVRLPGRLQVTQRRIPALPAARATTTLDSATRKQRAPEPVRARGAGRGRGPHKSSTLDPGLRDATGPVFWIPGEPNLGAGRGE